MSSSAIWLLSAFALAVAAYAASLTIGFVAPLILLVLGLVSAAIGAVLDVRARRAGRSGAPVR